MKKSLYLIILLISYIQFVSAQQKPQYTQYIFDNLLLNPAVSGIENYTDVKLGYRSQWTGLQGAPVTAYFTITTPLGDNFINGDATSAPSEGPQDPASRSFQQYYEAAAPHHGIGFTVVTDKAGPLSETDINATYAYHIGLAPQLNLALGVSAGVDNISLNTSQITLITALDPAISNGSSSQWKPDVGTGVWLYSSNYYFGVSVQQLLPQNLNFSTSNNSVDQGKTVPHYFITSGVKIFLTDDIAILPSALIKVVPPAPITYDASMKISFSDKFWIGGSYRHGDSFSALAGFNISSFINIGYSYDITTSALNTVSNGSHEIVIGILLNNKYKVTCPQHTF